MVARLEKNIIDFPLLRAKSSDPSATRTPAKRSTSVQAEAHVVLSALVLAPSFIRFQFLHPSRSWGTLTLLCWQSFTLSFLNHSSSGVLGERGGAVGTASFPFARSATVNEAWTGSGSGYVYWRRCQVSSTICNRSSSPVYWFNIQYGLWVRCVTGRCRCTFRARACTCIGNYVTVWAPFPFVSPPPWRRLLSFSVRLYPFPSSFRPFFIILWPFTDSLTRVGSPLQRQPLRATLFLHPSPHARRGIRVAGVLSYTYTGSDAHSQGLTMYSQIIEFAESTCALLGPRCRPCPIFLRNGRRAEWRSISRA